MTTHTAVHTLPFRLGEPRSFRGLATIPLFPAEEPRLEYIGLDEAVSRGLEIAEVDSDGIVGLLAVSSPLREPPTPRCASTSPSHGRKCLAYLVCSPRLLEVNARTIDQMRLANALCRFVELADSA